MKNSFTLLMSAVCLFALLIRAIRQADIKKAIVAKRAGPRRRARRALPRREEEENLTAAYRLR